MEDELQEILSAAFEAADPREAVLRFLGDHILTGENVPAERVFVLSVGKAAPAMAGAAEELLGLKMGGERNLQPLGRSLVALLLDHEAAENPVPDERGVQAARKAGELAVSSGEEDLLLALISGGTSALLADPVPSIELAGLKWLTGAFLPCKRLSNVSSSTAASNPL